jgi:hypothetical protein
MPKDSRADWVNLTDVPLVNAPMNDSNTSFPTAPVEITGDKSDNGDVDFALHCLQNASR